MKCAILTQPGNITITEAEKPTPKSNEVLIEVEMAAICGSDASVYGGKFDVPLPLIPGHEAVGRIVSTGESVSDLKPGQRVVIQPNYSCENCSICQRGMDNICPDKVRIGLDVNGVFGQYVTIPSHCAWPVPDSLDNEVAVFTEPTAVVYHAFTMAKPAKEERVLVFGAGVIGLLMVQLAARETRDVYTTDLVAQRLSLSEDLGAKAGIQDFEELSKKGPFDVIYETSGAPSALSQAIEMAAPGARIVVLGLPGAPHPVMATPIVRKELKIFGSMIYTDEFPAVLEMLANGDIQTRPLVSGVYPLEELSEVLNDFSNPDRVKTLIRIKAE